MPIRVLVVDDSAFARKVVGEVLSAHPRIEVVDIARDGLEALEKIAQLQPDVVTLDLVMPNLDGLGVLRALPAHGGPRVVVVSISGSETEAGIEALHIGAVDLVQKPTAMATERLYELGAELVAKVLAAADARILPPAPTPAPVLPARRPAPATGRRIIVIGASTGGPPAVQRLLSAMPADLRVPIAVVIHLPVDYTDAFARRLDTLCALSVREAADGMALEPGMAVVARGGIHLGVRVVDGVTRAFLDVEPLLTPHRPAVDVLFQTAAAAHGAGVIGVVLTGMGDDGCEGARAIKAAGGTVLTESEASCVVYGMPRCVVEAGLSDGHAPLDQLARLLLEQL